MDDESDFRRCVLFITALFLAFGIISGAFADTDAALWRFATGSLFPATICGLGLCFIFGRLRFENPDMTGHFKRRTTMLMMLISGSNVLAIVTSLIVFHAKTA